MDSLVFDSSLIDALPQLRKYYEFEELIYNLTSDKIEEVKEKIKEFSPEEYPLLRMCIAASSSKNPFMLKELSEIWMSMGEVHYSFLWGSIFIEYLAKKGIIASHLVPEYIQPDKSWDMMERVFDERSIGDFIHRDDVDSIVSLSVDKDVLFDEIDFFDEKIDPLSLAAFCYSVKSFKYILLNSGEISKTKAKSIVKNAIKGGSEEIIELSEQNGFPIDESCLVVAFKYHSTDIAQWLISNYGIGSIELIDCITSMNTLAIAFGIVNNLGLRKVDKDQHTVLIAASCIGYQTVVEWLLKNHRDEINIEAKEVTGMTALDYASFNGHSKIVSMLIDAGSNVEDTTNERLTPLLIACTMGQYKCVEILVNKGNASLKQTPDSFSPLIFASYHGSADIIEFLLSTKKIGSINEIDAERKTALHYSASHNFYQATKVLLEHGANPNLYDNEHQSPLYLSVANGEEEEEPEQDFAFEEEEEEEEGYDPNEEEEEEEREIESLKNDGVKYGKERENVVKCLLDHGADMYARDSDNESIIDVAISMGSLDVVKLFIEHGYDVNKKDLIASCLHISINHGFYGIFSALVDAGADVNVVDKDNDTPLHLAASAKNTSFAALLLSKGAKIDAVDKEGFTPLKIAQNVNNKKMIKFLLAHGAKE